MVRKTKKKKKPTKRTKYDVHFIFTGGTIDSAFDGHKDTVVINPHSFIPEYLRKLSLYKKIKYTEVCMKDSRDLTRKDLQKILKVIEKSSCKKIIITQGTYTMPATSKFIEKNLKDKSKTVVFTGAMFPLHGFVFTDAPFNLGFVLGRIQEVSPGVYVCMNGRVFEPKEVMKAIYQKVIFEGRFVSTFGAK